STASGSRSTTAPTGCRRRSATPSARRCRTCCWPGTTTWPPGRCRSATATASRRTSCPWTRRWRRSSPRWPTASRSERAGAYAASMSYPVPETPPPQDGAGVPDGFQRLGMPHRMAYLKGENRVTGPEPEGCPFCRAPRLGDAEGLIVARGALVYTVLNLYPYNAGHLMVCPYRHIADYTELDGPETAELAEHTKLAMAALRAASRPRRLRSAGLKHRHEHGQRRRGRHHRAPAPARSAPVGRGHQLPAGGQRHQGAAPAAERDPRDDRGRLAGPGGSARPPGLALSQGGRPGRSHRCAETVTFPSRRSPPSRPGARAAARNAGRSGWTSRAPGTRAAGRSRSGGSPA